MPGPQIVVIGLGVTGSAALWQLARRGARAIGIEQFESGHDRGSSHGPTRIIRLAHFENPSYVPLLRRAYALWRELEAASGQALVVPTGIVEIGKADGALVSGTLAASRRHALAHEIWDAATLTRRCPAYRLPQDFVAVWQPDGGYIEAAKALAAYHRLAAAAGAHLRTGETVLAIEPVGNGVRIKTNRAEIEADDAVVAAGPWLPTLLPDLKLPLRITRQVVGWFQPADAALFAADRFPVFLLESRHGLHYGFPSYGHMGVKICKHHHVQEIVTPNSCDREVTARDEAAIRAPLPKFLPAANGRLLAAHTCLYTMTPDETFILDRMPGFPHVVIASPCCGHGFKFSPVIGEIIADLVARQTPPHDIAQFRLRRSG